jgi:hypothetical protein
MLIPYRGILPPVDPLEALTATPRPKALEDSAPAAADWLNNPASIERLISPAQRLAAEPAWVEPGRQESIAQ